VGDAQQENQPPSASRKRVYELTEEEKKMTVEEWMRWNVNREADRLEKEGVRLVEMMELQGAKAKSVIEALIV